MNWAVYTVIGRKTLKRLGSLFSTAWAMLLGWSMFLPFFGITAGWREWEGLSARGWGAVLFLGIGCSGLGYLFWYGALEQLEASRVAAFLYIEPIVTLCAAALLLGERVGPVTVAGGLLVLAGVFLVQGVPGSRDRGEERST